MNIDLKQWRERIDNLLDLQQCLQLEATRVTFSRSDLIELRLIINSLEDCIDSRADVIDEAINLFDVCTCENCAECENKDKERAKCEAEAFMYYKEIVEKLKELKEQG